MLHLHQKKNLIAIIIYILSFLVDHLFFIIWFGNLSQDTMQTHETGIFSDYVTCDGACFHSEANFIFKPLTLVDNRVLCGA